MKRAQAEKKLAALGFEIDWNVTGSDGRGFSGTIDPIGRLSICGDCFGPSLQDCDSAAEFYRLAIQEAKSHVGSLVICNKPDCDMHSELPPAGPIEFTHARSEK